MRVRYRTNDLERSCCDERQMVRTYGSDVAKRLRRRLNALYAQPDMPSVRSADPAGHWHELRGDLAGLWAGDVSRNWRIEVEPGDGPGEAEVTVVRVEDYH